MSAHVRQVWVFSGGSSLSFPPLSFVFEGVYPVLFKLWSKLWRPAWNLAFTSAERRSLTISFFFSLWDHSSLVLVWNEGWVCSGQGVDLYDTLGITLVCETSFRSHRRTKTKSRRCQCLDWGCIQVVFKFSLCWKIVFVMVSYCSEQNSSSRRPLSSRFPTPCLARTLSRLQCLDQLWRWSHQVSVPCRLRGCIKDVLIGKKSLLFDRLDCTMHLESNLQGYVILLGKSKTSTRIIGGRPPR